MPKKPELPEVSALRQLKAFFEEHACYDRFRGARNCWLTSASLEVYVRKSMRHIGGFDYLALDIASITANPPRNGIGTRFITKAHRLNPWHMTFVENALNPFLARWLELHGWEKAPPSLPLCYFKMKGSP